MAKKARQLVQVRIVNGEVQLYLDINTINDALNDEGKTLINKDEDTLGFELQKGGRIMGQETQIKPTYKGDTKSVKNSDYFIRLSLLGFDNIPLGRFTGKVTVTRLLTGAITLPIFDLNISQTLIEPQVVSLKPPFVEPTADKSFWAEIINTYLDFKKYKQFIDLILCTETNPQNSDGHIPSVDRERFKNRLPFLNVDEYALLKFATDRYLQRVLRIDGAEGYFYVSR